MVRLDREGLPAIVQSLQPRWSKDWYVQFFDGTVAFVSFDLAMTPIWPHALGLSPLMQDALYQDAETLITMYWLDGRFRLQSPDQPKED